MAEPARSSLSIRIPVLQLLAACNLLDWIVSLRKEVEQQEAHTVLWWPVFFALGIGVFFSLPVDPPLLSGVIVLGLTIGVRAAVYRGSPTFRLALFAMLVAAGFCAAQLRTVRVAAPVLMEEVRPVTITGTVVVVEPDGSANRVTLNRLTVGRLGTDGTPDRVRVRVTRV